MSKKQGRALWFCVIALAVALWVQSYNGRKDLWKSQVRYCTQVSVPGGRDAVSRDADLSQFAYDAAAARRADGQFVVAAKYAAIAKRAGARADRTSARAAVPCSARFPHPQIWG